jgi:alkylation response protein AidB-like acyl-CoA dehydrogenase
VAAAVPPPPPPLPGELPGETAAETAFRLRARAWWAEHGTPRPAAASAAAGWQPGYDGDARSAVEHARAFQRALADAGLAGITVPADLGGAGLGVREQLIALDESEPYEDPTAHLMIGLGMCVPTLVAHGTDEQRRRHVPALLRADEVWCQLFSEPGAGSDLAGLQTRAVRDGETWVVDGQKVWTSGAQWSDRGILLARTDPDVPKHAGLTMFVCDMHRPGVTVRPLRQMTGTSGFNEVFLDGVRLPADAVVGAVGDGWRVARTTLMNERVAVGAGRSNVPGVPAAVLVALARSRGVEQDLVVRQRLADAHVHEVVLAWTGQRVRAAVRAGRPPGPEASIAKVATAEHARRTTDLAVALAGIGGLAWPAAAAGLADVDRWARALAGAPGQAIGGGTSEILRSLAGERVLGLPREPRS